MLFNTSHRFISLTKNSLSFARSIYYVLRGGSKACNRLYINHSLYVNFKY
ncbi:hypothetical protein HZS_3084 [Henneguya salminicola]|nr:hypothetical protein HZS_3084 [Henneguya salminicola]